MFEFDQKGKEKGIFISQRHLSWVLAGILLTHFFIFMSGFFLGQKNAIDKFAHKIEQESLADQIYSSMCALYDSDELQSSQTAELSETDDSESTESADQEQDAASEEPGATEPLLDDNDQEEEVRVKHYAQLVGYSSLKSAEQFARKMAAKNIKVQVKKRHSMSSAGKVRYWYQVVTMPYEDKAELERVIARLELEEKLQGVSILSL